MNFLKQYKNKMLAAVIVTAALLFTFWWGGNSPGLHGINSPSDMSVPLEETMSEQHEDNGFRPSASEDIGEPSDAPDIMNAVQITQAPTAEANTQKPERIKPKNSGAPLTADEKVNAAESIASEAAAEDTGDMVYSQEQGMELDPSTVRDKYRTAPVPEGKPVPVEPQNAVITDRELTCTLSVRCDSILRNIDWLDPEKAELVPADGVIFEERTVTFYEGESVFNLLRREMKKNKIHMEFENTPMYNSAYIEGINNLYEFDCGELSGWMYKVNGWFPNYGCSRYKLKEGDRVEWVYTCDLGADVGGFYAAANKSE